MHTRLELESICRDYDFWREGEHGRWRLISFCHKSAIFGELGTDQTYGQKVVISRKVIKFLRGVEPDALFDMSE